MSSDGTSQAYGVSHVPRVHRDLHLMVMAFVAIVSARIGSSMMRSFPVFDRLLAFVFAAILVALALRSRTTWAMLLVSAAAMLSTASSLASHRAAFSAAYEGPAIVRDDPQWKRGTTRLTIEIEGKRFSVLAGGQVGRRLMGVEFGEVISVTGRRTPHEPNSYDLARHVVGRFEASSVSSMVSSASPVVRSTNRLRDLLVRAGEYTSWSTGGLYLGLVVGDDRFQSEQLIGAFREAGLSHLTAVSGQNIALMLGLLQPMLRRLGAPMRTLIAVSLVAWFVVATRAEPSVIRASASAVLALFALSRGRTASGIRILAVVTLALVIVDPLLAWSVGFLLSVSATWGIVALSPWLNEHVSGPPWFRSAVSTTVGAQLAVIPVSLGVFGRVSVIGFLTNLPAVPLASFVMVVGLPLGLVVGALSIVVEMAVDWDVEWLWRLAMLPVSLAMLVLRKIALVASLRH